VSGRPVPQIAVVFGTRPEAIKCAPVIAELRRLDRQGCRVCVTAQHREMLDQVTTAFGLIPDVDLNLMQPGQGLASFMSRAVEALDTYLKTERPALVLVQGDTTTAFCAALAALYNSIPVGHIEAGLRTWRLDAPWPEEANRQLVTRLAAVHFAPTAQARCNLLREGVADERIIVTGNTIVDVVQSTEHVLTFEALAADCAALADLHDARRDVVLITLHRRESFGEPFQRICGAIRLLARRFPEAAFVYPVHMNPEVQMAASSLMSCPNVRIVAPLGYVPFLSLMKRSRFVITDSGGVQEEAPTLKKKVLVVREFTERPEAIESGWAELVGTDPERLIVAATRLLSAPVQTSSQPNPFGDGRAGRRIAEACLKLVKHGDLQYGADARPSYSGR
jgi:UDP-N-acetylglucosamine 2-epimerase (non-hydrolysing)